MSSFGWHAPLDPECPAVAAAHKSQAEDPMWTYADIGEEWWADFEKRHRSTCTRCQVFGAENIEVVGP